MERAPHSLARRKRKLPPSPPPLDNQIVHKRQRTISTSTTLIQTSKHTRFTDLPTNHTDKKKKSKKQRRPIEIKEKPLRPWVFSSQDSSNLKDKVVIVSYNILGVQNASNHSDLYSPIARRFLNWERRKSLICHEISLYHPGIMCFQEVDRFSDLAHLLEEDGFDGVHKARTGEACDGCTIFWKKELFTLLHHESIEYREFDLRDNVAQFCVLKMNSKANDTVNAPMSVTRSLLVANIHALFNPKRGDIKLGQVRLLVERAHRVSEEWGKIPVVLAGDLNSTPQSAIYQFLASSELDILLHDRKKISGQMERQARWQTCRAHSEGIERWTKEELQLAAGSESNTHLHHHLQLSSAYAGVAGSSITRDGNGEPLATTHHSNFTGTVDYIWHCKKLVPVGVVETLPVNILRKNGGIPSENWGSDHLALVCQLAFTDDSNEEDSSES